LHAFKIRIQVFLYLTSSQPFSKGEGQEEVLSFGEDLGEVLIQQVKSNHMETILNLQQVSKTYKSGSRVLTVLDNVSFAVQAGSALSIVGPSGSGKTTLLGLCAGLDRSSSGNVELQHMQLEVLNED
jgi:ABC-type glutathione transport system ATPase component